MYFEGVSIAPQNPRPSLYRILLNLLLHVQFPESEIFTTVLVVGAVREMTSNIFHPTIIRAKTQN